MNRLRTLRVLAAVVLFAGPVIAAEPPQPPPDVAGPPADAVRTSSGLASKILQPGTGVVHPGPRDHVVVHYTGWTTDGSMFDSSVARGEPVRLPLDRVIQGWTEGLQLMTVGERRRLWIPQELAYQGRENRPAGMLVFDVELLDIVPYPEPPADVSAPPAEAEKGPRGIFTQVLQKGAGTVRPSSDAVVSVHYNGWTTDGTLFDSSVLRGAPATLSLTSVIPGWQEALQLMVEGEKRRLWIPEDQAYKGEAGKPRGMLVFDVELLSIVGTSGR